MGARTTETNRVHRGAGQTSCTNVPPEGNLGSQLSIFDTAAPQTTRPNEITRAPSNDPPERVLMGALKRPARTILHGPPERPKQTDKGELGKRATQRCTKPTSSHNLAFFIRPSPERTTRTSSHGCPQTTRPNDPPERVHTGALKRPAKRPTRTTNEFTQAPSNNPPEQPTRTTTPTSSHRRPQTTRPNDFSWAPERPK
jgi:hypothetical protein